MQLSYAFLADSASVENGKVYVLGGGVTILWRDEYPAPMGISVVFGFAYNGLEAGAPRPFKLQINDADGNAIVPPLEATLKLPERSDTTPVSVPLEAAFSINIAPLPVIPAPGSYVIELLADGNHVRSLPFAVVPPPEPPVA